MCAYFIFDLAVGNKELEVKVVATYTRQTILFNEYMHLEFPALVSPISLID